MTGTGRLLRLTPEAVLPLRGIKRIRPRHRRQPPLDARFSRIAGRPLTVPGLMRNYPTFMMIRLMSSCRLPFCINRETDCRIRF
jgi:hypothetical protein